MTTETPVKDKRTTKTGTGPAPGFVLGAFATLRRLFGGTEKTRERIDGPPTVERGTWELTMSVEPDECDGGFVAECIEVPGAMGQGETEEEALRDLAEAINAIVEVKLEQQHLRPRPSHFGGPRTISVKL